MQLRTKTIILFSTAVFIVLVAGSILLLKPLQDAIGFIAQNKDFISQGLKAIELKNELKDAVAKKEEPGLDVLHYNIGIDLYPDKHLIKGDIIIRMSLSGWTSDEINLDFYDNMKIKQVSIDGRKTDFIQKDKILSVLFKNKQSDTVDIRIVYEGTPQKLGFGSFCFPKVGGDNFVYTMNEPVYASTWMPCIDLPTDKALTDVYISNDSSMVSLSNGKLIDIALKGDRKIYHWKTFYPISTYLVALYSADYKTYSQKYISESRDTVNLFCYATPEKFEDLKRDFSDHAGYMKIFEELFGPYPFPKEKYGLAEFWWSLGAMESQTITGVGTNYISGRKFFSDMLIHELSHHWWGDAVTPKSWKDIWLNEGFATYSEGLYWEKKSGFSALQSTLNQKFDEFKNGTLYNPIDNLFSRMIYDKGAWVLHMLRKEIGDDNFFKTLKEYFKKYKYKNASTEDFKNICEKISDRNLKHFFDQWVYKGEGIIEIEYSWRTEKSGDGFLIKLNLEQQQNGYDTYKFPLNIKIIFEDGSEPQIVSKYVEQKNMDLSITTKSKPGKIILDQDKWLLAVFNRKEN
jgi:aminopeptidase N